MPEALLEDLDTLDLEAMKVLVRIQQRKLSSHETEIAHLKLLLDKLRRAVRREEREARPLGRAAGVSTGRTGGGV